MVYELGFVQNIGVYFQKKNILIKIEQKPGTWTVQAHMTNGNYWPG